jgi:hypothetical protein
MPRVRKQTINQLKLDRNAAMRLAFLIEEEIQRLEPLHRSSIAFAEAREKPRWRMFVR